MTVWHFEFSRIGAAGSDKQTHASQTKQDAVDKAKSIMETVTFPFGKANRCVIKTQDGIVVETLEI